MKTLHEAINTNELNGRWCVYSHYDGNGRVEQYVIDALKRIGECGFKIVVLSTSPSMDPDGLQAMKCHASTIILRENVGYDFGSYKLGIEYLTEIKATPCKLLITNDSVFGPFHSLEPVLAKSEGYDLYAITDSIEFHYHLQSYFIIYSQRVIQSSAFKKFWNSVELHDTGDRAFKQKIIHNYEVGGSQFFLGNGFTLGSAHGFKKLIQEEWEKFSHELDCYQKIAHLPTKRLNLGYNASHTYWKNLILGNSPYVKRELLALNPINVDISEWAELITEATPYDVTTIMKALYNQTQSDDFFYTSTKSEEIAAHIQTSGEVSLPINPHLLPWKDLFNSPAERCFVFDEEYYLNNNPDVRNTVEIGAFKSGLDHFTEFGYKENRIFKLRRAQKLEK